MKCFLLTVLLACQTTSLFTAQRQRGSEPVATYELYSWRDNNGVWSFSVMGTTSRMKTPEEIFSEKEAIHGVDNLKRKISRLVWPSRVVWVENLVYKGEPIKGTERLAWPPKEIIKEVRRYAATRQVEVVGPE
jgi:hypothetical protein